MSISESRPESSPWPSMSPPERRCGDAAKRRAACSDVADELWFNRALARVRSATTADEFQLAWQEGEATDHRGISLAAMTL
jgi:hypothetical protein